MLEGKSITKSFGGLIALNNVDFMVKQKEIVGLIGPNGAGKTTLFNVITGIHRPDSGVIKFRGENIIGLNTHEIIRRGIARTFQLIRPFLNMTALDNVVVAILAMNKKIDVDEARKEAEYFLEIVGFPLNKKNRPTKNLTLIERKMVELARALATKPAILLLDEYAAGLTPTEVEKCNDLIKKLRSEYGITIFWIEHVMRAIMSVCDRIIVLHHGHKIAEGTPKEIASDEQVIKAYLGEKYA